MGAHSAAIMTHLPEHSIGGPRRRLRTQPRRAAAAPRLRCRDARWPAVAAALSALRATKRCSVRIIDTDCGTGTLLLCAARHARMLGFTAIEVLGIDDAEALVERARVAANGVRDPAIGLTFETRDLASALGDEADFPADIVLWHGAAGCSCDAVRAVECAGRTLIAEPAVAA